MAHFGEDEYRGLIRYLNEHPAALDELRPLVLSRELLGVPEQLSRLTEQVAEQGSQLAALSVQVAEQGRQIAALTVQVAEQGRQLAALTVQVAEQGRQLAALTVQVAEQGRQLAALTVEVAEHARQLAALTAQVSVLSADVAALVEDSRLLRQEWQEFGRNVTKRMDDLVLAQQRHESRHGQTDGQLLEARFARNLTNWLRKWIRDPEPVRIDTLDLLLHHFGDSSPAIDEVLRLDFLLSGRKPPPGSGEVLAAVEISWVIDEHDLQRAHDRAQILREAGYEAVAIVGGYEINATVQQRAVELQVGWELRTLKH